MTTADDVDRIIGPADEDALRRCVRRYFPAADGRLARAAACTFTNTPDGHFILDRHPRWPQAGTAGATECLIRLFRTPAVWPTCPQPGCHVETDGAQTGEVCWRHTYLCAACP